MPKPIGWDQRKSSYINVSGSDPTLLQARAVRDGDEWVVTGHKWFTSGAVGADLAIAMVVTDPEAPPYSRASMICVPTDTPGLQPGAADPGDGPRQGPRARAEARAAADLKRTGVSSPRSSSKWLLAFQAEHDHPEFQGRA